MNLAISGNELFVPEYFNDRIQVFSLAGVSKRIIGSKGSGPGQFSYPIAIAIGDDGSIFVADYGNNRIQKWLPGT